MKKQILIILFLIMISFSSCTTKEAKIDSTKNPEQTIKKDTVKEDTIKEDSSKEDKKEVQNDKKIIYTSFFPVYDLTTRIVGEKMEVRNIIDGNEGPHSFELKAKEMTQILDSDLIVFNGAGMEIFIDDLKDLAKDENKFLDLSQGLTLLRSDMDSDDMTNVNPHTWLSIKNAMIELDTIYQKISSIDPANDEYYKKNLDESLAEFAALEKKFGESLSKLEGDKYFVASHAAFNYLANDYGLKQVAVTGISPDEEPTAKELKEIADFVKSHNISTIFFEGKSTPKVAETLARETGLKTSTLYTLENINDEEMMLGYVKLMEINLENLVKSFD